MQDDDIDMLQRIASKEKIRYDELDLQWNNSEKNMIVNGKDQLDVMHDYIYYIKDNGVWKVVNIKAGE